jgi:hypothetical protein
LWPNPTRRSPARGRTSTPSQLKRTHYQRPLPLLASFGQGGIFVLMQALSGEKSALTYLFCVKLLTALHKSGLIEKLCNLCGMECAGLRLSPDRCALDTRHPAAYPLT